MYTKHSSAKNCNANGFFVAVSAYLLTGKARSLSVSGCEAVGYVLGGTCLETGLCRSLGGCMSTKESAVYSITNRKNGKRYIGSTSDLANRWKAHRLQLKNGNHHSTHLQHAWNQDGKDSFVFEVLEKCAPSELQSREQYWIDTFRTADDCYGYNIAPRAYSTLGIKASTELRQRMSETRKGESNANAILSERQVIEIKQHLAGGATVTEVAQQYPASYFVIWDIATGKRWKHVEVEGFAPRKMGPPAGEANGQAKMTIGEIASIKKRLASGESWIAIAESLGVDRRYVHEIQTGRRWASVQVEGFTPKIPTDQRGSKHPHAKLTESDVLAIRMAVSEGKSIGCLAKNYGITKSTVSRIVNRKGWNHV